MCSVLLNSCIACCCDCRKNKVVPAQIHEIQAVMLDNLHASRGGAGERAWQMCMLSSLAVPQALHGCSSSLSQQ